MRLSEYLEREKVTDRAFAQRIAVHPATVLRLKRGERSPSLALAQKIMAATDGAVEPADFFAEAS